MKILHTIDEPVPVRKDVYVIYKIGRYCNPVIEVVVSRFFNQDIQLGDCGHKNDRKAIGWVYAKDMLALITEGVNMRRVMRIANDCRWWQNWDKSLKGGAE